MVAAAADYRPQTRWCGPPPYPAAAAPPSFDSSGQALLAQLRRDLQRGHWRVALRRFLMLQAYGFEVPPAERRCCLQHASGCASREWQKMQADVDAWARCLGRPGPRHGCQRETAPGVAADRLPASA